MDINRLRTELENDEGRRHVPYRDTLGNWTCGIGHLLGRNPYPHEYWSDAKIDGVFAADIKTALAAVQGEPWWVCLDTDDRQRAVMNMVFNLGKRGLEKFHVFLRLLEQKHWTAAAEDLRHTRWFQEVPARAARIVRLIRSGGGQSG